MDLFLPPMHLNVVCENKRYAVFSTSRSAIPKHAPHVLTDWPVWRLSPWRSPVSVASTVATVAAFTGSNGKHPTASLTDVGGTLYGTAIDGGMGHGTLFSYDSSSGRLKTVVSFTESNGGPPWPA